MLACNLALNLVPAVGIVLAQLLLPLLECGLLYASLAADRGEPPRLRHLIAVAAAPPRALAAVIAASLVIFAVESLAAQAFGDVNMLVPDGDDAASMSAGVLVATYAAGILASLPLMFVPFVALFDGAGLRDGVRAELRSVRPQSGPAAVVWSAVVRAADARDRDERLGSAARVAMVRRGVVRGVEGDLQRRVTATVSAHSYSMYLAKGAVHQAADGTGPGVF